ncbi:SCO1860 family LAETG-anchored protein [Streptomyces tropicalis]|uniref:SCO1860 family LAETG-anchored protein n=1 Tax=Streptomyces tropicalis TaxID=3034234 RepID=A0ABT6ABZ7_9ACTN|nr:SCO1860 family LAETG-anchored protein [Streptomyces tropicalis]MDF3302175.1 SCO1860 family LAETG-anchored protein [Streptomyces tropicalis]
MNGTNFRMPARRCITAAVATALAAGPVALTGAGTAHAGTAHAATGHGRATAVVLRTGLDVSLLNRTVNVPLSVSLNDVRAPRSAEETALTARLDGVDGGRPFSVLRADVASAKATADAGGAEGSVRLAHARLHVPGLPLLSLVEVEDVTAKATCAAGKAPSAESDVLGSVTVLGRRVTLTAGGTSDVRVPGVGEVRLDLSKRRTTSRTAAATALELRVSVNPLKLNVAEVEGRVTLAEATCHAPAGPSDPAPATSAAVPPAAAQDTPSAATSGAPAPDVKAQGAPAESDLAETGGSALTPYLAGGSAALLAAGGGAVALARRRRR